MVPADDDEKLIQSTKSGSSKGLEKEVGKLLLSINNAFKTMGKALSQVHEEFGALEDNESLEEHSHAQLSKVVSGTNYSFATSKLSMRNYIMLDNQSLVHVFCNPQFVTNVREAVRQLILKSNSGKLPISKVADYEGFCEAVWFLLQAITNILSLTQVKQEYDVSFDWENFIVHRAKQGYTDMVIKPHSSGLHVYDPEDIRGYASYNIIQTLQ